MHCLDAAVNYLSVGRWMQDKGFGGFPRFARRERVFEFAAARCLDKGVLYLEFGVYKGESIRYWSQLLNNDRSFLHGFDTFEGLPERWNYAVGPGVFSTNGVVPKIDDDRVTFFKGPFDETLPLYVAPPHEQLIVNVDSDLYSSAATVLRSLESLITPGTLIYFDEFCDRMHELKAFDEFLTRTAMSFRVVAATRALNHIMFERTG